MPSYSAGMSEANTSFFFLSPEKRWSREFSALVTVSETVILSLLCLLQQKKGLWFESHANISETSFVKYIKKDKVCNKGELIIPCIHNYAWREIKHTITLLKSLIWRMVFCKMKYTFWKLTAQLLFLNIQDFPQRIVRQPRMARRKSLSQSWQCYTLLFHTQFKRHPRS